MNALSLSSYRWCDCFKKNRKFWQDFLNYFIFSSNLIRFLFYYMLFYYSNLYFSPPSDTWYFSHSNHVFDWICFEIERICLLLYLQKNRFLKEAPLIRYCCIWRKFEAHTLKLFLNLKNEVSSYFLNWPFAEWSLRYWQGKSNISRQVLGDF